MSQSQQSNLPSSLYDGEIDNLTYLTHSHPLATPSETQHTFDILDTSFLRPAIPLTIPSILERVGPDRRKAYILYNEMSHNEYVEWWLQTDYGTKSKINWDSNHLSDIWKHFDQVAHSVDSAPKVMCKRCCQILEHPYSKKKDGKGRDTGHGLSTIIRHLKTASCLRSDGRQKGEISKFLQKKVCFKIITLSRY
jgi:hypothetical protein